jgi:hypothetical protein
VFAVACFFAVTGMMWFIGGYGVGFWKGDFWGRGMKR